MTLSGTVTSATAEELAFIAAADYGQDVQRHLNALRALIFSQEGLFTEGQYYFPYEVIELTSHALKPGHEREFAICTLLVIHNVVHGADSATDLSDKFQSRAQEYDLLPSHLRDEIISAYLAAEA